MTITPYVAHTPDWHAQRLKVIGGSEVAALFGVQPDYALSHWALWQIKSGRAEPPGVDNPRVRWGLLLEDVIAQAVAEEKGWAVEKGGYATDDTTAGMGASLDYVATAPHQTGLGVLECKNTDWLAHKRSWTDDEPPLHILLQLQHQLACAGASWGAVACLIGGNDLRVYEYEARPKLIAQIRAKVTAFWQSIADNRPPSVDGSDSASAVLRALYAPTIAQEADLTTDNDLPDACVQLLAATERRREAERQEAEAKNRIFEKLQDHQRATTSGFRISVSITEAKPDRVAEPGEVIRGRAASRRLIVKERTAA